MKSYAPIALFTYNRPQHSLETLQALKNNPEARHSRLYIFADGPKANASEEELKKIQELRAVIAKEQWCGEVVIKEADINRGLAASIVEGVSRLLKEHGKLIILEDDIVSSPGFLAYMNHALDMYEKEEKVMHISAYMPDIKQEGLPETFFLRFMSCWGWATWKDSWEKYIADSHFLLDKLLEERELEDFNLGGSIKFHNYLKGNLTGTHNSWAIKWFSSIYFSEGLCLSPRQSLVQNIGFDGSGTHYNAKTEKRDPMLVSSLAQHVEIDPTQTITEHRDARKSLARFYKYLNNYSAGNIIRSNLRWMKHRLLMLKDYHQKEKYKSYANTTRIHS